MRVVLAFFLGIAVTIGGAYVHDMSIPETSANPKRLVNWDAAGAFARSTVERAREEWDKLTAK